MFSLESSCGCTGLSSGQCSSFLAWIATSEASRTRCLTTEIAQFDLTHLHEMTHKQLPPGKTGAAKAQVDHRLAQRTAGTSSHWENLPKMNLSEETDKPTNRGWGSEHCCYTSKSDSMDSMDL